MHLSTVLSIAVPMCLEVLSLYVCPLYVAKVCAGVLVNVYVENVERLFFFFFFEGDSMQISGC